MRQVNKLVEHLGVGDPEDLREVISAYQQCVAETVRRFGGFVAKYMGGGVLVYYGYPQAHEDDAERAVRAGLELLAAVAGRRPMTRGDNLRYAIAFALRRSRKIIRGLKEGLTEDERATRLPIMPSGNSRSAADPWRLDEEVKAAAPMTI